MIGDLMLSSCGQWRKESSNKTAAPLITFFFGPAPTELHMIIVAPSASLGTKVLKTPCLNFIGSI